MKLSTIIKRIKIGNSLVYYSVYFLYKNDEITKLRRKAFFNAYKNKNFIIRTAIYLYSFFIWPFNLIRQIYKAIKIRGKYVKQNYNKSYLIQILEQLQLGLLHTIPVRDYYNYKFFFKENKINHYQYLYNHEVSYLFDYLSNYADKTILSDKYEFYKFCKKNDIPTIPILELITKNKKEIIIPNESIFVKPRIGHAGNGISKWVYNNAVYESDIGLKLSKEELTKLLLKQAKKQDYIIQPVVEVNENLKNFTDNALPTIRLVSKIENNNVEIIFAYHKIGVNNKIIDNSTFGFPINVETGVMYKPEFNFDNEILLTQDNILIIKESWDNIIVQVTSTHKLLNQYRFLAFDIAITSKGITIIEPNHNWSAFYIQKFTKNGYRKYLL